MVIAFFSVKVYTRSWKEFDMGTVAYEKGDYQTAILHYERAIKHYTPWSKSVRLAVERLWQIGASAEESNDLDVALAAYRTLRSSLYAVQSLYIPYADWIPKSETKIAALMVLADAHKKDGQQSKTYDAAYYQSLFERKRGANLGWSVVVEIGFLGWVGAVTGLIWHIRDKDGSWSPRQGMLWGSGAVICFAVWLIGMMLA